MSLGTAVKGLIDSFRESPAGKARAEARARANSTLPPEREERRRLVAECARVRRERPRQAAEAEERIRRAGKMLARVEAAFVAATAKVRAAAGARDAMVAASSGREEQIETSLRSAVPAEVGGLYQLAKRALRAVEDGKLPCPVARKHLPGLTQDRTTRQKRGEEWRSAAHAASKWAAHLWETDYDGDEARATALAHVDDLRLDEMVESLEEIGHGAAMAIPLRNG